MPIIFVPHVSVLTCAIEKLFLCKLGFEKFDVDMFCLKVPKNSVVTTRDTFLHVRGALACRVDGCAQVCTHVTRGTFLHVRGALA